MSKQTGSIFWGLLGTIIGLVFLLMIVGFINCVVNPPQLTPSEFSEWKRVWSNSIRSGGQLRFTQSDVLAVGYGKFNADFRVPFDNWMRDPDQYRINTMNFFEKSFYGAKRILTQRNAWEKQEKRVVDFSEDYNYSFQHRDSRQRVSYRLVTKSDSYKRGYDVGWDVGYDAGINGQEMGYDCDESGKSGDYLSGYLDGYVDGYTDGINEYDKDK